MKRCTRCILPDSYPNIIFDNEGVCNYCLNFNYDNLFGKAAMLEFVNCYRKDNDKYDCLLALSGGRDSTFALYYAVAVLGLNPLAFTVDNGFLPSTTHENIADATQILGVDHVYIKHDLSKKFLPKVLSAWMHRPSAAMVSLMCLGCRLGMMKGFIEISNTFGQQLCISGGGEPEKSFATAFFTHHARGVMRLVDMVYGMGIEFVKNWRYIIDPQLLYNIVMEYLYQYPPTALIGRYVSPPLKFLPLFRYIPYDESEIMNVIQNEMKWKKWNQSSSAWRSDCKINVLKNKLYLKTIGFSKNDEFISGLIRTGNMKRGEALSRVSQDNIINEEFIEKFVNELGLSYEKLYANIIKAK